jgi:hypothetical protein
MPDSTPVDARPPDSADAEYELAGLTETVRDEHFYPTVAAAVGACSVAGVGST